MLGATSIVANAAPAGSVISAKPGLENTSVVEKVAYRRCWWRDGARHCRWVHDGRRVYGHGYGLYFGRPSPEAFPPGSSAWWRAMDYEGRGGHGRTR
jgi:hypothetical protein